MNTLFFSTTMLAIESNGVVALRLARMAEGGAASRAEAVLMVQEKVEALIEAGTVLMTGGTLACVVARYREHVQANADRLLAH